MVNNNNKVNSAFNATKRCRFDIRKKCNNSDVIGLRHPIQNCSKIHDFKSLSGLNYLNLVDYLSVSKDICN
jgi:hypothetical protein